MPATLLRFACVLTCVRCSLTTAGLSFYFYEVAKDSLGLNEPLPAASKQKGGKK